ncbi:hypothetical protein [Pseudonocardia acidicola]|uniref:Uncharacterized protein n=1 Tax=Pseudonocardia acidicola TaxID=2724939 RepID=A0ABX1SFI9_9PSEU|nr:hypothetical protein [Pseudonocardia acidicola]NMH99689.1 hypothetical protein [Pseudonocardia acidicola]
MADPDTLMWEVRAAPDRLPDLLHWIRTEALDALRRTDGWQGADVYTASDERAVVIVRFDAPGARLPEPPADLVRRPAHQWPFRHLLAARP